MKSSGPTKVYPLKDSFLSEAEELHFDCMALTGSNLESTMRRSHGEVGHQNEWRVVSNRVHWSEFSGG